MASDFSFKQYLDEIGRYPLLDRAGEVRLAKRIEAGQPAAVKRALGETLTSSERRTLKRADAATNEFYLSNLRLVVSIARKRPHPPSVSLMDMIQDGNIGLWRAVQLFDWRKGFKFSTYGTWWIRQTIDRGLARTGRLISLPVRHGEALAAAFTTAGGDVDELPPDMALLHLLTSPVSISMPLGYQDGGSSTLGDMLPSGDPPVDDEGIRMAEPFAGLEMLERLPAATRTVVEQRLCLPGSDGTQTDFPVSYEVLGELLGVSSRAAQHQFSVGLKYLRHLETEHRDAHRKFIPCNKTSCRFNDQTESSEVNTKRKALR